MNKEFFEEERKLQIINPDEGDADDNEIQLQYDADDADDVQDDADDVQDDNDDNN